MDNLYEFGFPYLYGKEELVSFSDTFFNERICKDISVENLSSSNRKRLFRKIGQSELTLSAPVHIQLQDAVFYKRQDSLWYGGAVAVISYRSWKFELYACGDVYAELYDRQEDRLLVYVKDKNNLGLLGEKLRPYINSDQALCAAIHGTHTRYQLSLNHGNWWEGFAYDPAGQFHDLMWCLESNTLLDALVEILSEMDTVIKEKS